MIYEEDRANFAILITVTWQSYGRSKPDRETMRYWFDKLIKYEFNVVANAFDEWLKNKDELPTINGILDLCKPREYTKALPNKIDYEMAKIQSEKITKLISELPKKKDFRAWAKKILANPSKYPSIAERFAKEAMGINDE